MLVDLQSFEHRATQENFPVASRFLPRDIRADLLAVYAFARLVDDAGDEPLGGAVDRGSVLNQLDDELDRAFAGTATHPVFVRLTPTVRAHGLDRAPFRALIAANRVDQAVTRYPTWDDLRSYCALSAEPVGRIVLAILGLTTASREAWSDDVCSALQVVEHLQDVGEDYRRGRVYLPAEDLAHFACDEQELSAGTASPALRSVVAFESARTRALLDGPGRSLTRSVLGRVRIAVAGFVGGGLAALDAIERSGYDVLAHRTAPSRAAIARRTFDVLVGRGGVAA